LSAFLPILQTLELSVLAITALTSRVRNLVEVFRWRTEFAAAIARALVKKLVLGKVEFVAITGSAGKTTTKDLCAGILSEKGPITKTQQSSNEPAMVANTVVATRPSDRYSIVEVSGGEPRAMSWPLRLITPSIAVVTLIQREHARSDFGLEDIATEKFRLVQALPKDGIAILNIDDPLLLERGRHCRRKVFWVGRSEGATLRLLECQSKWPQPLTLKVEYKGEDHTVVTALHGEQLALSVLCALAVAVAAGMELPDAIKSLRKLEPSEGRMQVVAARDDVTFLRDDWKAPLWSLDAPMNFMRDAEAPRKVMVIGTLSDYSRSASKLYPQVAERALEIADQVIFVGAHAYRATKKAKGDQLERLHGFAELRQASLYLREVLRPGDLVLLKGSSRADHLVRLILDRESPVACWESRCGKSQFCTQCPRAYDFSIPATIHSDALSATSDALPLIPSVEGRIALVGLGNPGEKYQLTRHNAGHVALDTLAQEQGMVWEQIPLGQVSEGVIQGVQVMLVKPDAAVNHSGEVIRRMLGADELASAAVVIHDDMDLEHGTVKVRRGGGDGGHLGVRSIIAAYGTQDFQRIRLGARPQGDDSKSRRLVHQRLSSQELQQLTAAFSSGLQQLLNQLQRHEASLVVDAEA
tara:strand:+ start:1011 stop:2933 length:1923 start_codon:yes stop_codon:yes gene_type:complete